MILSRKANRRATAIIFVCDALLMAGSFALAWWLRFESGIIPMAKAHQAFGIYAIPIVIVTLIWLASFGWQRLFRIEFSRRWGEEISKILKSSAVATVAAMSLTFVVRSESYSRLMLALGVGIVIIATATAHRLYIVILRRMLAKGVGVARKLVIGDGEIAISARDQILADPLTAKGYVGRLCTEEASDKLGAPSHLKEIIIDGGIDEVVLAEAQISESAMRRMIYECRKEKVLFVMIPQFQGLLRGRIEVEPVGELGSIVFVDVVMTGWQRYAKRAIDLFGSLFGLIVLSPFLTGIALAIKIDSKGPVFFKQERIGKNGRKFMMLKFRSMFIDAEKRLAELLDKNEAEGALFKMKDDPRITKVGKFLRKFSLDEFPQLINVLRGDMSLVGPRPPLEREIVEYESWQLKRVDTVPGMTGLWQVSGRSNLPFEEMVRLDIFYIEHWSLWLDIKILFKTIPAVIFGRGAY
ncbi:MAG TPA: sugar transferase [candidate division Zixibacteria bacterium]|nr:sugar transferase [candidate division Zixibacteria bacterium]